MDGRQRELFGDAHRKPEQPAQDEIDDGDLEQACTHGVPP
jgi:hypothetical protein